MNNSYNRLKFASLKNRRFSSEKSIPDVEESIDIEYEKFKKHLQKQCRTKTLIGFKHFVSDILSGHLVRNNSTVFHYNKDEAWSDTFLDEPAITKKKETFFGRFIKLLRKIFCGF